jgi:hypothetical protein
MSDPVEYPIQWKPKGSPPFPEPAEPDPQLKPLEVELVVAAMSDAEFEALTRRTRGGRN